MIWITSKNRKIHQRKMNKAMRQINKDIQQDSLWRGRFCVRQKQAHWEQYSDGSGAELMCLLEFIDKKTGLTNEIWATANQWLFGNNFSIWCAMNNFIIKECKVWQENPRPGSDDWYAAIDW